MVIDGMTEFTLAPTSVSPSITKLQKVPTRIKFSSACLSYRDSIVISVKKTTGRLLWHVHTPKPALNYSNVN